MTEVINGYECVLNGEANGASYLLDLMDTYRITDDEIIYLVHAIAELIERRPAPDLALVRCHTS